MRKKDTIPAKKKGIFVTINGIDGSGKIIRMRKEQLKNTVLSFQFDDKNLSQKYNVSSFHVKIPGMQDEEVIGNKMDERIYNKILKKVSRRDQITISEIKSNENNMKFSGIMYDPAFPIIIEIY